MDEFPLASLQNKLQTATISQQTTDDCIKNFDQSCPTLLACEGERTGASLALRGRLLLSHAAKAVVQPTAMDLAQWETSVDA